MYNNGKICGWLGVWVKVRRYRYYYGNAGCYLWLIMILVICTLPLLLWIINAPLQLLLSYIEWGQEVFGFEDKSFGLILYTFGVPWCFLFILYKCFTWLESKMKKNNNQNNH
jgi:hypothetical protein